MLPPIHVLLLCTLPGKTAEGKRSLAKKLPFLLSGLPHAVQPSFWPKPRALHVPMTQSSPAQSAVLSSLGPRTLSCWYLSDCPLWRSPFPSRLWRLSGHCRCRFNSHLCADILEQPFSFCPYFVVVFLSPPCCWGCSWGCWQSPWLDLPPLCFLPRAVR